VEPRANARWLQRRLRGRSRCGTHTPFDIGSDMAGSIRIPAHYCCVYGYKPTARRISTIGHIPEPPGCPRVDRYLATAGPLARDVRDLAFVAATVESAAHTLQRAGAIAEEAPVDHRERLPLRFAVGNASSRLVQLHWAPRGGPTRWRRRRRTADRSAMRGSPPPRRRAAGGDRSDRRCARCIPPTAWLLSGVVSSARTCSTNSGLPGPPRRPDGAR